MAQVGKTYFIIGANRGIGFNLAKSYSEENPHNVVLATARNVECATELQNLAKQNKNVFIVQLDIADSNSIDKLDAQISTLTDGIDVFISNAGVANAYTTVFDAPKKKIYKFLLKRETRKVIFISTAGASITGFFPVSSSAYGQSKAALNYSVKELSFELEPENFIVVAVHPGTVSIDLGTTGISQLKKNRPELAETLDSLVISPNESISGLKKLFDSLEKKHNGFFWSYDGSEIPF
ncbi:uncharacterized protein RJT20DRAFT_144881 [Scheffersomyces xylosifermentans]|uniref:uncharacterized protein n=1 Tax=Scheffersomyces xylosifermentans TaxID=1304137 RepID=UPI00315D6F72